ncbi:hypothetical protein GQ53DRAFT_801168 [Thozetella sp. PMI_491]|nr:hypothetical protein GQ53DRAFT_801168 [Thozetella sp. PMI_491]
METNRKGHPRQRKAHRKSRRGCTSCKQRRTRCDEELPVCLACLVYGTDCIYPSQTSNSAVVKLNDTPQQSLEFLLLNTLSGVAADPFDTMPVKMTHRSSEAFYIFIQNRTMLAPLAAKDKETFNSSLGLANVDSTWFQLTLCTTASYRSAQSYGDFGETYLHHRQGLLEWLKEHLSNVKGTDVPASYISVIGTMVMTDGAAGDMCSVAAHLKAILALLDTRRQLGKDWRFYDDLMKRILIMTLCLSFALRHSLKTTHASGLERPAAPMHTQIVNEFLRTPVLTGSSYAAVRTDGPILAWLEKTLREKRCFKIWGETFSDEENRKVCDNEEKAWIQAVSAYALTVGTMDWFGNGKTNERRLSKKLKQLRMWWAGLIENWIGTKRPMTDDISKTMLEKIKWLESDEGLEVLHEIVVEAKHDAEYREGLGYHVAGELSDLNMSVAPEYMCI